MTKGLTVLFIGDIVSKAGRRAVRLKVPELREKFSLDLVIANGENAAGGFGINKKTAQEILEAGVDVITLGNHTWDNVEVLELLQENSQIIRPSNLHREAPGKGYWIDKTRSIAVVNLQGKVFMDTPFPPFPEMRDLLEGPLKDVETVILDFHAEATAEKMAMAYWLDGRVTAVIGTHTHVQTNDARLTPNGTFYLTDVGMCGSLHSIIGMKPKKIIEGIFEPWKFKMEVAKQLPYIFNGIVLNIYNGRVKSWHLINDIIEDYQ